MDNQQALSNEEDEFLDSLLSVTEYVCTNCLSPVDADYLQVFTYCEICEAVTEVKQRET